MHYELVSQAAQNLKAVLIWLDKAEQNAANRSFNVNVLLDSRLAPDMKPFTYQIQSACDYLKGAAAWLSGQAPPIHEDNEKTAEDLRARIHKTVAFSESVQRSQYSGAGERKVRLSWKPGQVISGDDYLRQITIPNLYFHLAMAYAILRHNGVHLGKMDFLGPMNFVEAGP